MPAPPMGAVVGREQELDAIERFLERASSGPSTILIEGESGVGKTTLWQAGLAGAARRSFRSLVCRPAESEIQMSYASLGDLFAEVGEEVLAGLPAPQGRSLRTALLRDEAIGASTDQRAVGTALLGVLQRMAGGGPVVVAVDDLQWIDPSSRRVLSFALRRLAGEPVGLLATRRPAAASDQELAVAAGEVLTIAVGPLSLGAIQHLVRTRLGMALSRPSLVRVMETSGGNPFFALEVASAMARRGAGPEAGWSFRMPNSLRGLIEDRLGRLTAPTRRILALASALSAPTVGVVQAAAPAEPVLEALAEADRAGVVGLDEDRIRFSHPLLRSALLEESARSGRRDLHRRLAAVVDDPEERARHLALGTPRPDAAVAEALDQAARRAHRRGAPDAAAELAELARDLTPPQDRAVARGRALEAAQFHFEAGDTAVGRALVEDLIAELPPGPERARALWQLGAFRRYEGNIAEGLERMEQALAEAGDDRSLEALFHRGFALIGQDIDPRRALEHADQAVAMARELGDPRALCEALLAWASNRFLTGHGVQEAAVAEAFRLEASAPEGRVIYHPHLQHAEVLVWADRLDDARQLLQAIPELAERRGDESVVAFLHLVLTDLEYRAGRFAEAEAAVGRGLEAAEATGQDRLQVELTAWQALLGAVRGDLDWARTAAAAARQQAEASGHAFALLRALSVVGLVELSAGRAERAAEPLAAADCLASERGYADPGVFRFAPDAVEALAAAGRTDDAERVLEDLEGRARALDRPWATATAARSRGLLAAHRGDIAEAEERFEASLEAHDRLGQPFERARTLLVLGQARRRAKQKRGAREVLGEAAAVFEGLGAASWAERARTEQGRVGGRPASPFALTETERQVAELVATGRSNREVAEALFMTVNTVEANLSRIYRKLQVRSRTELAAKLRAGSG